MSQTNPDRFELWLGRVRQIVWLSLGAGIGTYETLFTAQAQPILLAFAVACLGLPIARALDRRLSE